MLGYTLPHRHSYFVKLLTCVSDNKSVFDSTPKTIALLDTVIEKLTENSNVRRLGWQNTLMVYPAGLMRFICQIGLPVM